MAQLAPMTSAISAVPSDRRPVDRANGASSRPNPDPFPRTSTYDQAWVEANSLGANVLHLTESLCSVLDLRPGMRVLDLGCGHALSSIFLAREFGVTVWAADLTIDPTVNFERVVAMECADTVFPLRVDARGLPLPHGYFDAIVAIDSYLYYGTDERFLPMLARHLKPGGLLGVVDACFAREIESAEDLAPEVRGAWHDDWWSTHSIAWWRKLWEKSSLVKVQHAELLPESERIKQDYAARLRLRGDQDDFIALMNAEGGSLFGSFRIVAQRTDEPVKLDDGGDSDQAY